jgi:hypothetical protein
MHVAAILLVTLPGGVPAVPSAQPTGAATASLAFEDAVSTTLVRDGQVQCAIHVAPRVLAPDQELASASHTVRRAETDRQRLRESVSDLAQYLQKMSGARVPIESVEPPPDAATIRILIGEFAAQRFGPPGTHCADQQAFRLVVTPEAVGLYGESDVASSYAIYELLHRLGCRWYMPSELGEVIPQRTTIELVHVDERLAPATVYRDIWHSDPVYSRRNRAGGLPIAAGHALEGYISKEQLEQHPDWNAEIGGQRRLHPCDVGHRLCWANPAVAEAVAEAIIARLDKDPVPSISLSPGDGTDFCQCAQCRALDTGDFDPTMNCVSITDRYLHFANQIAQRVAAKHPDVMLGFLAYVQFTRPPLREPVHANLYPQVAPITYSRAHPMTDDRVPGNRELRYLVEGWGRAKPAVSYYLYSWFLAEANAPNPLITKWRTDLPILYRHRCTFWQPEGITNFETSMHGIYLGLRLAWDPAQDPAQILHELNAQFYGHASEPMGAYWRLVDEIWINTPEYSGCGWGHLARFTPPRLAEMRRLMDAARAAAGSDVERARIQIADDSLRQFELFMKLRRDLAEGHFTELTGDMQTYIERASVLADQYAPQKAFGKMYWVHSIHSDFYLKAFYQATYTDAARIADSDQFVLLTTPPIRQFRFHADREKEGERLGWMREDFDDQAWHPTDPCLQTWSSLGLHDYMGTLWYRTSVELPAVPDGKRVSLWLAATDGRAKLFVNGRHVGYVSESRDAAGNTTTTTADAFSGYAAPASFDITDVLRPGLNQITLQCIRLHQNELGTGGLLGPVVVYRQR